MNTTEIQALLESIKKGEPEQAEALTQLRAAKTELAGDIKTKNDLLIECQKLFTLAANPGYPEKQREAAAQ